MMTNILPVVKARVAPLPMPPIKRLISSIVGEFPRKYIIEPIIWNTLSPKAKGRTLEILSKNLPIIRPTNISDTVAALITNPSQYTWFSATPNDLKYSHNVGKITARNWKPKLYFLKCY